MIGFHRPHHNRARGLLLFLTGLLLLAGTVVALARQQPSEPAQPAAESDLPHQVNEKRHFYATGFNVGASAADASCAPGYHMASVWEILDPSELTYANLPVAETHPDQGGGPVAGWWGWARTGAGSSVANVAGQANCAVWSSDANTHYGTIVRLAESWTSSAVAISPWQAQTWLCSGSAPVWCVSDPVYGAFAPFVSKQ